MAKKKDANQPQIEKDLTALGFSVASTHELGNNLPDLLVALDGFTVWVEIKSPNGKASEGQIEFTKNWQGASIIAKSTLDILIFFVNNHPKLETRIDILIRLNFLERIIDG